MYRYIFTGILLVITSCETTPDPPVAPIKGLPAPVKLDCNTEPAQCTDRYSPTQCVIAAIDGLPIKSIEALRATHSNACRARAELLQLACQKGYAANRLRLRCFADPSEGNCPIKEQHVCPPTQNPSHCIASRYHDQYLTAEQAVHGRGLNKCHALYELQRNSCARQLNPALLSAIHCQQDRT